MARHLTTLGNGSAWFSDDEIYRYELTRELHVDAATMPPLVVIGLNPSTATAETDDPTVHKESKFAIRWGYGSLIKLNAYGFRATEPKDMFAAQKRGVDIVGDQNDTAIHAAVEHANASRGRVLVAWGNNIELPRQAAIMKLCRGTHVFCLKKNKNGTPSHPLYQPDASELMPWSLP